MWTHRQLFQRLSLAVGSACMAAHAWATLPAQNLLVEWRTVSATQADTATARVGGGWQVDTQGQGSGGVSVSWGRHQQTGSQQVDGQVQVLNGGRASLTLTRSAPVTRWQWLIDTPVPASPGSAAASGAAVRIWPDTRWVDRGQGLQVSLHWPGGQAPVVLELDAEIDTPEPASAYDPDGQAITRSARVRTTLRVPLDTWVPVARQASPGSWRHSGSGAIQTQSQDTAFELHVRVRKP